MSDEAIVQEAPGAAPSEQPVSLPNPISTEPNPGAGDKPEAKAETPAPEKKLSVRESLEAAAKKTEQKEVATDKAKPLETSTANRDDKGKFAAAAPKPGEAGQQKADPAVVDATAKPAATVHAEAPTRFSNDAKAAWATAPEPLKAEVHRAIRELDQGIAKYKPDAEKFVPFKEFHDLATSLKVDPARALREYVTLDKMLGENFPEAMARICQNKRVDIRAFAADVLQLNPQARAALKIGAGQQQAQPVSPEVLALRNEIAQLKQQIGGVTGHVQQQQAQSQQAQEAVVNHEIATFKTTNPPLFDELSQQIAEHIANSGLSLQDAYAKAFGDFQDMAQRAGLKPQHQATTETADLAAQTLKGQKSITGAPGAGSAPATQKPSSSIREALRKAMQAA